MVDSISESDGYQIRPLLTLLRDHVLDRNACSKVCAALENLTFTDTEHRRTIVQHGGIEAIIAAMDAHKEEGEAVQRPAMDALWNLTFDDDAVDRATDADAIVRIAETMRQHADIAELQASACAIFLNLAVRDSNRSKLCEAGCLGCIAAAMERHYTNEEVLEQGCQALYMLAYHQDLRPLVLAAKGND